MSISIDTGSFTRRFFAAAAVMAPLYALYQVTNHIHLRTPVYLPVTVIDRLMPFWPWTGWPYLIVTSAVVLMAWVTDAKVFWRALTAMAIGFGLNIVVWAIVPTVILRPPVPLLTFASSAYRFVLLEDSPANCFPSGHVTMPVLAVWAFLANRPRHRIWMWTVFWLFTASLLTTKQHYAVDIAGGLLTALFGLAVATRLARDTRERRPAMKDEALSASFGFGPQP